jgi:hypothetical protein
VVSTPLNHGFNSGQAWVSSPKSGWWYTYPSEKYDFVSWDDEIPNVWKKNKCSKPPTKQ